MVDIDPMYYVQTCLFEVITFLLLLTAASTSLAQLFLPAGQRQAHHLPILRMVAIADILQILSQLDPYAVFGIYSTALAHLFQVQVTSFVFYLCAYSLNHNFGSLYHLMQQAVPRYLPWLLWTLPVLHHLIRTVSTCFEFTIDLNTASASFLSRFIMIRSITFTSTSGTLIILSVVLVTLLSFTIRSFIRKLEHLQKREIDAAKLANMSLADKSTLPLAAAAADPNSVENLPSAPVKPIYNNLVISGIQTRINTMQHAMRQVLLGTFVSNLVLMTAFAVNASRLDDIANHRLSRSEFVVTDPSVWAWRGISVHLLQMVALILFTWYTWRSPMLWIRSPYPFMSTMSFGLEFAEAQAAKAARVGQDPTTASSDNPRRGARNPKKGAAAADTALPTRIIVDSESPKVDSDRQQRIETPARTPLSTARTNMIVLTCQSPKPQEDPHADIVPYICPGTVQSTTRQIPLPPFNSMIDGTLLHIRHTSNDSQLPPIFEQPQQQFVDIETGEPKYQYPAVLIGESKLFAHHGGDMSVSRQVS